jgi:hypothetical protein
LHLPPSLVDEACLSLAQLPRKFAAHAINRDVHVVGGFFCEDVSPGNSEMNFGAKAFFRIASVVVNQNNVGGDDVCEVLKLSDHRGDVLMQRR